MTIFVIIQYLNMKFNEFPLMLYDSDGNVCARTVQFRPKHFREIFYPALYAETGEGDLEDDADAAAPPPSCKPADMPPPAGVLPDCQPGFNQAIARLCECANEELARHDAQRVKFMQMMVLVDLNCNIYGKHKHLIKTNCMIFK